MRQRTKEVVRLLAMVLIIAGTILLWIPQIIDQHENIRIAERRDRVMELPVIEEHQPLPSNEEEVTT